MDCKDMTFVLKSGNKMPLIGFGTYQIRGRTLIRDVIDDAFNSGYRQIDTAAVYGNEQDIGIALKELLPKYKLKREDIFITSKLSPSNHGDDALKALEESIKNLDCGYLDLYLIHWPGVAGIPVNHPDNKRLRLASWASLVRGVQKRLVRDIGVSNYTVDHLNELFQNSCGIKPSVNQVECHPYCHQYDLKQLCQKEGILLQAYSSLGGSNNPELIFDPVVCSIAEKLGKSPAQILLRWALQQNIGIIPKARSRDHIQNNIDLNFVIPNCDISLLNNITRKKKFAWDPRTVV